MTTVKKEPIFTQEKTKEFLKGFLFHYEPVKKNPLLKKTFWQEHKYTIYAFLIPMVIMIFAFYTMRVYSFGNTGIANFINDVLKRLGLDKPEMQSTNFDNQFLAVDSWHQYYQFLNDFHDKLRSGSNILYTWNGGGGTSFFALSYYVSSPLQFLTVILPQKYLAEAMTWMIVLKVAFSGMFFHMFLKYKYKRDDLGTATFAMMYAASAYAVCYCWCYMWLDAMALLPLILLGMTALVEENKYRLFTISLAVMLIANYYLGAIVCIFLLIYYPVIYFSSDKARARGNLDILYTTAKVGFAALLGVGIAFICLWPTYLSMQNSYYVGQSIPKDASFYNPILDVVNNLLPNSKIVYRQGPTDGLPNIYCSLAGAIFAVMYFMCKKIKTHVKIMNAFILLFLIYSFNSRQFDFVWHLMKFPNEIPFRQSFVFTFVLVSMAYAAFIHIDSFTKKQIGCVFAGILAFLVYNEKLYKGVENWDWKMVYIPIMLLCAYMGIIAVYKTGKFKQSFLFVFILVFAFIELASFSQRAIKTVGVNSRTSFIEHRENLEQLINEQRKIDNGFYRMEMSYLYTSNPPAMYTFPGITQFNSGTNKYWTSMMQKMGLAADPGSNSALYGMTSPVTNSLLNIKYMLGRSEPVDDFAMKLLRSKGSSYIYENKYPLSIGFMADKGVLNWGKTILNMPKNQAPQDVFSVHTDFINSATGIYSNLYEFLSPQSPTGSNINVNSYDDKGFSFNTISSDSTSSLQADYIVEQGGPVYANIQVSNADSVFCKIGDKPQTRFEANRSSVRAIGTAAPGERVRLEINFKSGGTSSAKVIIARLNEAEWDKAYSALSANMLNITKHTDTKITGTVNAAKNGVFMTSIPYERGWSVKVDGKNVPLAKVNGQAVDKEDKQEILGIMKMDMTNIDYEKPSIIPVGNAFLAFPLSAGPHTITLSYTPDGFIAGTAISIVSLGTLFAVHYLMVRIRKTKEEQLADETEETDVDFFEDDYNVSIITTETDIDSNIEEDTESEQTEDIPEDTEDEIISDLQEADDTTDSPEDEPTEES